GPAGDRRARQDPRRGTRRPPVLAGVPLGALAPVLGAAPGPRDHRPPRGRRAGPRGRDLPDQPGLRGRRRPRAAAALPRAALEPGPGAASGGAPHPRDRSAPRPRRLVHPSHRHRPAGDVQRGRITSLHDRGPGGTAVPGAVESASLRRPHGERRPGTAATVEKLLGGALGGPRGRLATRALQCVIRGERTGLGTRAAGAPCRGVRGAAGGPGARCRAGTDGRVGAGRPPCRARMLSRVNREHLVPTDTVPRAALWILVPAALATLVGLALLWPSGVEDAEDRGYGTEVEGRVLSVHETECGPEQEQLSEQLQADRCGDVVVRLSSGPDSGAEILVDIPAGPGAVAVEAGQEVVLIHTPDSVSEQQYHIVDHDRSSALWALVIAFALAVVAFGRWKGLRSLASLGLTFAVVLLFVVPAVLDGRSPMAVAIVGSAAIMLVSLYLAHGWNRTTTVAVLGTLASLVLTGVLAQAAVHLARLNGVLDEETTSLAMQ